MSDSVEKRSPTAFAPPAVGPEALRSTGWNWPVRPGERPTTALRSPMPLPKWTSIDPSGRRTAWTVTVWVTSKPRTPHQVTVVASDDACRKTRPLPVDGSRSAKNGATRGGPVRNRDTLRSELAVSLSPNVMLPSEFTNACVCDVPKNGNPNGTVNSEASSSASARGGPTGDRNPG